MNSPSPHRAQDSDPFSHVFEIGVKIQHLGQRLEGEVGLSLTQRAILRKLLRQPASSAQALAESVGIQPATLTQALKRLEKKGLIHLAKDRRDLRKKLLSVTRQGKNTLDRADAWLADKAKQGTWRIDELMGLLAQLDRVAGEP